MQKIFSIILKYPGLIILSVLRAILELAGLALFVPLMLVLLEEDGLEKSEWPGRIYTWLNIGSPGAFLILVCGVILIFTILKNICLISSRCY